MLPFFPPNLLTEESPPIHFLSDVSRNRLPSLAGYVSASPSPSSCGGQGHGMVRAARNGNSLVEEQEGGGTEEVDDPRPAPVGAWIMCRGRMGVWECI